MERRGYEEFYSTTSLSPRFFFLSLRSLFFHPPIFSARLRCARIDRFRADKAAGFYPLLSLEEHPRQRYNSAPGNRARAQLSIPSALPDETVATIRQLCPIGALAGELLTRGKCRETVPGRFWQTLETDTSERTRLSRESVSRGPRMVVK